MKLPRFAFAAALAASLLASAAFADADRWTLKDGKTVKGELIGCYLGAAFIEVGGGRTFTVPVSGLAEDGQRRAEQWLADWAESRASGARRVSESDSELTRFLAENLIRWNGSELEPYAFGERAEPDFYAFYYSAHWCGPCREFTPELRAFYNDMRAAGFDNFEIVFVSSDKSSKLMRTYMSEDDMPWPAVPYAKRKHRFLTKYEGSGIPCLVVTDRQGRLLYHSYHGEEYVGPDAPKRQLDATLRWLRAIEAKLRGA